MSYLLDTNVVCEAVRPRPEERVIRWLRATPDTALHLSVLSLGEIRRGVEESAPGRRRERLRLWLEQELPQWFEDRLLPVTGAVAECWGRLLATTKRPLPAVDALLAATAIHHGLRIVTRNESDFRMPGIDVVNPWKG